MWSELVELGTAALRLPGALRTRGCATTVDAQHATGRLPVVLVHGWAGTQEVWQPMSAALHRAGFGHVVRLSYDSLSMTLPEVVQALAAAVQEAREATGAPAVHLVGHSFGGLVVRHAVQAGGPAVPARTAITVATPHRGAGLARLAPGACGRSMRPGSPLLAPADGATSATRWVAFWSDGDRVVPPASAQLTDPRLGATNVLVRGCSHLSICRDAELIVGVVAVLLEAEADERRAAAA